MNRQQNSPGKISDLGVCGRNADRKEWKNGKKENRSSDMQLQ